MILSLDIGTSSVRAALYDAEATAIPRAAVKIERSLTATADGGSEINADEALAQVVQAIDALLQKTHKLKDEFECVASCSFWHSLVGIDADGKPTTKVFSWADTRSGKYPEVLRKKFDETATHNRTGARFHSSFWPAKLLWLRKDFPEVFARTETWLSFSDYVALKLFGKAVTSVSMASGTGIFDIRKCVWDKDLLRFLRVKAENLPTVAAADADTFQLTTKFAKRWPRLSKAKWFPAYADGATDNVGAGCVTGTKAALMIGTSGAMRVAYDGEPPENISDGLWCYRVDRKRVIIGGALSDGGGLYHWIKQNLRLPLDADAQIATRSPGSHGLTFLPFLAGERSTGYHESATGSVLGLTSATDAVDILHAALESVAYRFAEILDQLSSVIKIKEIVASGGALRESPIWTQIIADVLGRDLLINDALESSSRGAVLLALESLGKIRNIKITNLSQTRIVISDGKRNESYRKSQKRHKLLYTRVVENRH